MPQRNQSIVSADMAIAGGNALLTARADLFELLDERAAQEIAGAVYIAMHQAGARMAILANAAEIWGRRPRGALSRK